jgi:hypothetical protein
VKLTYSLAALAACAALAFPATGDAAGPQLKIPDFGHLRSKAIDSVDITLDGMLLNVVKRFAAKNDDGDQDEALAILSDIKSLRVRNFEFDSDGAYSHSDIESVRQQLSAPGWTPLVQAHKREPQEDVDVFINIDGDKIMGMAVVVSEPRSFTIVNIIGSIDIDKLAKIEGQFGIPQLNQDKLSKAE